jgi:hypothetical protein
MEGMNSIERLRFITKRFIENRELMEGRAYHKRTLTVAINLDEILHSFDRQRYGRPVMTFSPKTLNCRLSELRLKFQFRKGNRVIPCSTLTFS